MRRQALAAGAAALIGAVVVGDLGWRMMRMRGDGTTVVQCIPPTPPTPPGTRAAGAWHATAAPFEGLQFTIYWSEYFQVREILFRNTLSRPVRFDFSVSAGGDDSLVWHRRSLRAGEQERPPGYSVPAGGVGRPVCVWVRHVWLGGD